MKSLWQRIRTDLIERRLLPIPIVLVAGLIAVPALAGHHRSTATAETLPTTTTAPVATTPTTPKASTKHPTARGSSTSSNNPFSAGAAGSSSGSSGSTASPTTTASTTAAAAPTTGATTTASNTTAKKAKKKAKKKAASSGRRYTLTTIDLRFGEAVTPKIKRDVARLSVFPDAKNPVALMFGTLPDRRSVVFYLIDSVTVQGTGACVPRVSLCTQLILKPGQRVILTNSAGKRYRLALSHVTSTTTTSSKLAKLAYKRSSKAGQCVLDVFGAYGYDTTMGAAFRRSSGKSCKYTPAKPKVLGAKR